MHNALRTHAESVAFFGRGQEHVVSPASTACWTVSYYPLYCSLYYSLG